MKRNSYIKSSTIIGLLHQNKRRVTIGVILTAMFLMTVVVMTPQYAGAQDDINQATVFDDNDSFGHSNEASISQSESASQTAEASASANSLDGGPSTISQEFNKTKRLQ
jgi:hypothetical protein